MTPILNKSSVDAAAQRAIERGQRLFRRDRRMKKVLLFGYLGDIAKNARLKVINVLTGKAVKCAANLVIRRQHGCIEPVAKVMDERAADFDGIIEVPGYGVCNHDDQMLEHGKFGNQSADDVIVEHSSFSPSELYAAYLADIKSPEAIRSTDFSRFRAGRKAGAASAA